MEAEHRSMGYVAMATATVISVAALTAVLWLARSVVIAAGVALLLSAGLDPLVRWIQRLVPRPVAVLVVVLGLIGVGFLFVALAVPAVVGQLSDLAQAVPGMVQKLSAEDNPVGQFLAKPQVHASIQTFLKGLPTHVAASAQSVLGVVGSVLGGLLALFTVLVLMIYFMLGWERLVAHWERLLGNPEWIRVTHEAISRVGTFVAGQLTVSSIAGICSFVFFLIIDMPYAALLGLTIAFLDLIPQIGATLGAIVCFMIALTQSLGTAIAVAIFFAIYQTLENQFIAPVVLARAVQLSPAMLFICILIGSAVGGIIGTLVALPTAAIIKVILVYALRDRLGVPGSPQPQPSTGGIDG